jgi:FtsP/CotA-like multicopper oxidase with cupredoxin domain
MDGPTGVTQCPIPPGGTFTYDFVVRLRLIFMASDQLTHA